ncbi:FIST C-terminal domain-containing protein [Geomonas sp. RF6]|uniref:FIST signal transduction protein n=1 Tax=Geomonas sp. RF6 TaxID=2897342 RepID=UPI001E560417|nr:FIST N-terminal domain-containing protein [Geomonas sp. RF6]UFS69194.1 FIST C-terminal domain-containing protein [Geomonas sp. RF6]
MNIKTVASEKIDLQDVVLDLQSQLSGFDTHMVVFFASSTFDADGIAAKMQEAFPGASTFGCTTAGELVSGKMLKNSVVAMAFSNDSLKQVKVAVVEDVNADDAVDKAFASFAEFFGTPMSALDPKSHLGLILVDGLSGAEERIIDRIGDLTNIGFIGGSAGDDLKFAATYVYANGKAYKHAALLAVLEPTGEFTFIKTQSFNPLPQKLVVTKAIEEAREVLEFNGKPAAEAYAEAVGTSVEEAPNRFMHNPVGLVFEGEPFVRSPQQINPKDGGMIFYCGVKEGMELSLLESTDIIADTKSALENAKAELGSISGIINFNCILRTLELGQKGLTGAYGELFSDIPTIGFSTYGEQFIGHINQTATMVAFK